MKRVENMRSQVQIPALPVETKNWVILPICPSLGGQSYLVSAVVSLASGSGRYPLELVEIQRTIDFSGSLVVRLVFLPFEESSYATFARSASEPVLNEIVDWLLRKFKDKTQIEYWFLKCQVTLFTKARTEEKKSPSVSLLGIEPETSWCSSHFVESLGHILGCHGLQLDIPNLQRLESHVGEQTQKQKKLGKSLTEALKLVLLIGFVVMAFGPSYSYSLIRLLYGRKWSDGEASTALRYYCLYVILLAMNGTTEAFLHAVANETQLKRSNDSLLVFSLIYLVLNVSLIRSAGAIGLILANSLRLGKIGHAFHHGDVWKLYMHEKKLRIRPHFPFADACPLVGPFYFFLFVAVASDLASVYRPLRSTLYSSELLADILAFLVLTCNHQAEHYSTDCLLEHLVDFLGVNVNLQKNKVIPFSYLKTLDKSQEFHLVTGSNQEKSGVSHYPSSSIIPNHSTNASLTRVPNKSHLSSV
ncbi:putative ribosomal protein L15 [Capsicum annuum]|nr:putative ribosomal protein L15 [Capsicum annuum]